MFQTAMRKGKNPDPGGPKKCGSPTLENIIVVRGKKRVESLHSLPFILEQCLQCLGFMEADVILFVLLDDVPYPCGNGEI